MPLCAYRLVRTRPQDPGAEAMHEPAVEEAPRDIAAAVADLARQQQRLVETLAARDRRAEIWRRRRFVAMLVGVAMSLGATFACVFALVLKQDAAWIVGVWVSASAVVLSAIDAFRRGRQPGDDRESVDDDKCFGRPRERDVEMP